MKKIIVNSLPFILAVCILFMPGCASIVSYSSYPVSISSFPDKAKVVIRNINDGMIVYQGETPANVKLKASNGFFKKANYSITIEKPGYYPKTELINANLDPWYFGNIIFGGLIGILIVDPATGAMYKLDRKYISEQLTKKEDEQASTENNNLKIYDMEEIPAEWKEHLVAINK